MSFPSLLLWRGVGKTEAVARMAREARKKGLRLAIVNPSNEQVFQTLRRLLAGLSGEIITYAPAANVEVPPDISSHPGVRIVAAKDAGACGLLVGTIRKLGDAFCRGDLLPAQLLILDEAYQAEAASYFTIADLAPTHFLVGDAGQLESFSAAPDSTGLRLTALYCRLDPIAPRSKMKYNLVNTHRTRPAAVVTGQVAAIFHVAPVTTAVAAGIEK